MAYIGECTKCNRTRRFKTDAETICDICNGKVKTAKEINEEWWDNFRGRCLTCIHAAKTNRKMEMMCMFEKAARDHGLGSRPGGHWEGTPVSKLFGCVYFQSAKPTEPKEPKENTKIPKEDKPSSSNDIPF